MTNEVPAGGLHPNIARIAAAYDMILEQLSSRQLTVPQARAKIAQLEARDDQGVRWSIDPDTGQFVRKTALGAEEYDVPPVFGYQTHDAFSYTQPTPGISDPHGGHGPKVENPNGRLEMFIAPMTDPTFTNPPSRLVGATRNGPAAGPAPTATPWANWGRQLAALPTIAKGGLVAAVLVLAAVLIWGFGGGDDPATGNPVPAPAGQVTTPAGQQPGQQPGQQAQQTGHAGPAGKLPHQKAAKK